MDFPDELWDPTSGTQIPKPPPRMSLYEIERTKKILRALHNRKLEALSLYKPMPQAQKVHRCRAPEVLVYGSNRSGKTTTTMIEVARAVTSQDPYKKYPEKDGRCYLVALSAKIVAEALYRKLFRAGAFKIIKDTRCDPPQWRIYNPNDPWDRENKRAAKPAPPLIPPRFVREIGWENKAQQVPNVIRLTTGWEMLFFTDNMDPPTSVDIDLLVFDEEITRPAWYSEGAARLVDRQGRFLWSATPQAATEQMFDLYQRSDTTGEDPDAKAVAIKMHIDQNPYLPKEAVSELKEKFAGSPYDMQVRIEGDFAIMGYRIYPNWHTTTHGIDNMLIPPHWCRYAVIDPGHDVTAVLFAAVPPDDDENWGGHVILYDELYLKKCDLTTFADAMEAKQRVGQTFQEFIIDHQFGRQTDMTTGKTREYLLGKALEAKGVEPVQIGSPFFVWGSNDIDAGIIATRDALNIVPKLGAPRYLRLNGMLPNFDHEIETYRWGRDKNGVMTNKPYGKSDHLMDCLRMLVMRDPKYVKPIVAKHRLSAIERRIAYKRQQAIESGTAGKNYVHMGPGA